MHSVSTNQIADILDFNHKKNILDDSECIQHADDSTIYRSCKIKNINKCSNEIESDLNAVEVMLISSRQMKEYHQLDSSNKVNIKCNNINIERVKKHFELYSHVNNILKDDYSTLQTLETIKNY